MTPEEVQALPKAEMHVHLEACARPALARRMAAKLGEDIEPVIGPDGESYPHGDFTSFLGNYSRIADLFRTADDYAELCETYLDELRATGTLYAEIIVWPDHPERLGLPADGYLEGIAEGIARHTRRHAEHAVVARLLVTGVRHEGADAVEREARIAVRWHADGPRAQDHSMRSPDDPLVVGFGLAGDERVGHPRDFARAFAMAREAGLGLGCHAGELRGAESVRAALDHLDPDRIDHGVRAAEEPELLVRLRDEGKLLTVCPGSNLSLGVYPGLDAHPLAQIHEAGVAVALGSDDPPHFGTSIEREYALAASAGLSRAELVSITATAIDHAFLPTSARGALACELERRQSNVTQGGDDPAGR